MSKERIVIVGGGFAGLNAAFGFVNKNVEVILVDKQNHHLFQPLLYQVATAALSPADIATPLREIFKDYNNINVIMGSVIDINKKKKQIVLGNGDTIDYDYLILAVGARHSYFGHNEWEDIAPGLKTLSDALKIREKILISFEKAERMDSIVEASKYLNFVIIGGGPTGVEMAGSIAEIAYQTLFKNFRRIKPEKSRIYLIEGAPRILPVYPPSLSAKAQKDLEKMGVKVITEKMVTNITEDGVQVGEMFIPSKNVIWAAGNQASSLLKTLNTEMDKAGRVMVGPDLSIKDHPEIFVLGDAACAIDKQGKPLPGIAPVAIQQGKYISKLLLAGGTQEKRKPFRYFDKGSMATIGKAKAVGFMGKIKISGFIAWVGWLFLHIFYLVGFRNRFSVTLQWFFHYITGIRGARLIHKTIEDDLQKERKKS
ncbi:MAG: NAD(P)/FAD-dependent oxidoreductase [Chlamydiales bacterium]|nr:NAD(P)/FAD-dependent oxidoreductase [Chlamydiales bacterium]